MKLSCFLQECLYPIALRKAKTLRSFGHFECNKVNSNNSGSNCFISSHLEEKTAMSKFFSFRVDPILEGRQNNRKSQKLPPFVKMVAIHRHRCSYTPSGVWQQSFHNFNKGIKFNKLLSITSFVITSLL